MCLIFKIFSNISDFDALEIFFVHMGNIIFISEFAVLPMIIKKWPIHNQNLKHLVSLLRIIIFQFINNCSTFIEVLDVADFIFVDSDWIFDADPFFIFYVSILNLPLRLHLTHIKKTLGFDRQFISRAFIANSKKTLAIVSAVNCLILMVHRLLIVVQLWNTIDLPNRIQSWRILII